MKKTMIALCVTVMLCFTLAACSGNAYEGEWKATDVENAAGIHVDPNLTGSSLLFELKSDEKGTMTLNGASVDISWSETDDGVKLEQKDDRSLELVKSDDKLMMTDMNGNKIYFEKQ